MSLKITYTKLGIMSGIFQLTNYDSTTRILTSVNTSVSSAQNSLGTRKNSFSQVRSQSQSQSKRKLSERDHTKLKDLVDESKFFQAKAFLSPRFYGNFRLYIKHLRY